MLTTLPCKLLQKASDHSVLHNSKNVIEKRQNNCPRKTKYKLNEQRTNTVTGGTQKNILISNREIGIEVSKFVLSFIESWMILPLKRVTSSVGPDKKENPKGAIYMMKYKRCNSC